TRGPDLAQIRAVRGGAADRITHRRTNKQVKVSAPRPERIIPRRAKFIARLPPAMLADRDAGIEVIVEPGAGSHTAVWRLDGHPVAIRDAADLRRCGMQLDLRIGSAFAKARELAMLSLAEQRRLGARQDQRKTRRQIGPRHRADPRLVELWQRRVAMLQKGLRVDLDLARGSGKAARCAIGVKLRVFGVAGFERQPTPAGVGAQLLEADANRRQLAAVGGIGIAIPELGTEAEPLGQSEDDVGVGTRLATRRHDGRPELDQRLRLRADVEAYLQGFALEGRGDR